jgi:NADPH:quinone reductase-like Zn-dependent oxidoreductase
MTPSCSTPNAIADSAARSSAGASCLPALTAATEDFNLMLAHVKVVLRCHGVRPLLDSIVRDLNCETAAGADEVVMVLGATGAVNSFAIGLSECVDASDGYKFG